MNKPFHQPVWLGIDLGTQSVRVVALTATGETAGAATQRLASHRDGPRHEQNPEEWWAAVRTATRAVTSGFAPTAIRALAVDGTSGTILFIDRHGQPADEIDHFAALLQGVAFIERLSFDYLDLLRRSDRRRPAPHRQRGLEPVLVPIARGHPWTISPNSLERGSRRRDGRARSRSRASPCGNRRPNGAHSRGDRTSCGFCAEISRALSAPGR
jgi:hypothetical protein